MSAVYNSTGIEDVKRGPCTSRTHEEELESLKTWMRNHLTEIYWLDGIAGTGKLTIS
jgi:hypothetical protein